MITCDENHIYRVDEIIVPGVSEILGNVGISDFSAVPEAILDRAINWGHAVHSTTELWDRQTLNLNKLDPQLIPALELWKDFLKKYDLKLYPEWIEKLSFNKKWRYGFTPDRVAQYKGYNILIDIKTGIVTKATKVQTAAYRMGIEEEGITIKERWVVYIGKDKIKIDNLDKDTSEYARHKTVFMNALNIYNFKRS
jgi:hypothetical protein